MMSSRTIGRRHERKFLTAHFLARTVHRGHATTCVLVRSKRVVLDWLWSGAHPILGTGLSNKEWSR